MLTNPQRAQRHGSTDKTAFRENEKYAELRIIIVLSKLRNMNIYGKGERR